MRFCGKVGGHMNQAKRLSRWRLWGLATIAVAGCAAVVWNLSASGEGSAEARAISQNVQSGTLNAGSDDLGSGSGQNTKVDAASDSRSGADSEASYASFSEGPAGYHSLLNRLISSGLMADFGNEFSHLLAGEQLLINPSCDLETFLSQLRACSTPEEIRAVLGPFAEALREAEKNKDPNLLDIQRQLGIALLFGAEQVAASTDLTPEQQLDTLVRIGGVLVSARHPQLALTLNDVALDFTTLGSVPDSQRNRKNVDVILRGRLEVAARVQDLQLFDEATERWVQTSKDQRDNSVGARWRLYAQRLATFPPGQVNSESGATWPGLSEAPAAAIINIGTGWLKLPPGANRAGYVAARDGLLAQLDQVIRERTIRGGNLEEVKRLESFRKKLAASRIR